MILSMQADSVKEHYDNHLGNVYSWMAGDFEEVQREHESFFLSQGILPQSAESWAIDLGAGHGVQSISLAKLGFKVKAVEFSKQLLFELENNRKDLPIDLVEDDIRNVRKLRSIDPELIVCFGDTIAHLQNAFEIRHLFNNCYDTLGEKGKMIVSFQDYSIPLVGNKRFVPVKNDHERILTCFMEYLPEKVRVTDLLYEFNGHAWEQKISSYDKVRVSPILIVELLKENGFKICAKEELNCLMTIIAQKS